MTEARIDEIEKDCLREWVKSSRDANTEERMGDTLDDLDNGEARELLKLAKLGLSLLSANQTATGAMMLEAEKENKAKASRLHKAAETAALALEALLPCYCEQNEQISFVCPIHVISSELRESLKPFETYKP